MGISQTLVSMGEFVGLVLALKFSALRPYTPWTKFRWDECVVNKGFISFRMLHVSLSGDERQRQTDSGFRQRQTDSGFRLTE